MFAGEKEWQKVKSCELGYVFIFIHKTAQVILGPCGNSQEQRARNRLDQFQREQAIDKFQHCQSIRVSGSQSQERGAGGAAPAGSW